MWFTAYSFKKKFVIWNIDFVLKDKNISYKRNVECVDIVCIFWTNKSLPMHHLELESITDSFWGMTVLFVVVVV